MLNLRASPEQINILNPAKLTVSCEFRPSGLVPFMQSMMQKGVRPDQWPTMLPFWILGQVYGGIDWDAVQVEKFVPSRIADGVTDAIRGMCVELVAIYDGYKDAMPCGYCSSTGKVLGEQCQGCGGLGKRLKANAVCDKCNLELYTAPYMGKNWDKCPQCRSQVRVITNFGTRN